MRRFLILPSFPINYFARGTGRTDIISKLYEHFADENIDNHNEIINEFKRKVEFISSVKRYCKENDLLFNRLALECFLWGLGVLDVEEVEYSLNSELKIAISEHIHSNINDYTEQDFAFSKEVMERYSSTAKFLEDYFQTDLGVYLNADARAKERIDEAKKTDDPITRLSELESLRLNKPEPSKNSIDDIGRMLTKRRFMIRPSYQRKEVINPKKASSIIESILLGITLPAIFVYKREDGIHEVIDGQQRLLTILGFTENGYINEKGQNTLSKNHAFSLRGLRILEELNGKKFSELHESDQDKIFDFQLYLVEIDEKQNPNFNPVDLFIRLNDKPYPIRENSFEMWNSWADVELIEAVKKLKNALISWFYVKQLKKASDRDRMENEELIMTLAFLEYSKAHNPSSKVLDVYQKTDRINARISTKAKISSLLQEILVDDEKKRRLGDAIKQSKSFAQKLKYILLDRDKTQSELDNYLRGELDKIYKAGRESRYFRRTIQDFYFMWLFLESINLEMIKYHRISIKKEIADAFKYIKNIPESDQENNLGFNKLEKTLEDFKTRYQKQDRKLRLSETQKQQLIREQGGKSSLSEAPIFLGDDIEVDHNDPLAIGGKDSIENVSIAHRDENRAKGAKPERKE